MAKKQNKIKIIPLGGLQEIGKNMTAIEYKDEMIVIDCGLSFPEDEMLGIDVVIPDVSYLVKNHDKLKGIFLTHGHEDHIGAIPYVLRKLDVPIYGTKFTLALVEHKLKENRISNAMLIEVGGVDNTLDELYNTIDVLTEAFSKYYWNDAEKVNG